MKDKKLNKIAEFQYNWLKSFLKPLFDNITLENVRKYKKLVTHQRKTKFEDLNSEIKQVYLDFSNALQKL